MKKFRFAEFRFVFLCIAAVCFIMAAGWGGHREPAPAFGGNFSPGFQQPAGAKYQIAGCDAHSAWIIDTTNGDVFLIYSNGKWKEVGSIMDEKKRIKK